MRCPMCGSVLSPGWTPGADLPGWQRRDWTLFESGGAIGAAIQQGASYERKRPVRSASVESDVAVPVLQAGVSGVVGLGLGVGIAAIAQLQPCWAWGLASGMLALGGAWWVLLGDHRASLWELERLAGRDLDGDGKVGRPEPERPGVRVEVVEKNAAGGVKRIRWLDLPVSDDTLCKLAQAVLTDRTEFSRRDLAGVLSPEKYEEVYRRLLEHGMLCYKGRSEQAGVELTSIGRAFLRQYLDRETPKW